METNCSNKIVSLHLERCGLDSCPHQSVCYLRNRTDEKRSIDLDIEYFLKKGYMVYEALCEEVNEKKLKLLANYREYHITVPFNTFMSNESMFSSNSIAEFL